MKKSLVAATAALLACASAQAANTGTFTANLLGSNQVGNPFDADGSGSATVSIDYHTGQVDWSITFADLSTVVAAHIHAGSSTANGGVVVNFAVPAGTAGAGTFSGTVIDPDSLGITALHADQFYVNVHTNVYQTGAIRGQLAPVPEPGTYALMLAGLAAVGAAARRRSR